MDHCRDKREGGTALHWAAYHGRLDIVKLLIEDGASMLLRAHNTQIVKLLPCDGVLCKQELCGRLCALENCMNASRLMQDCAPNFGVSKSVCGLLQ